MLDDFADEVADIVGISQAGQEGGKGSRLADLFNRQKVREGVTIRWTLRTLELTPLTPRILPSSETYVLAPSLSSPHLSLFILFQVSQKFGAEVVRSAWHGGDEDLPRREALHERRVKFDAVAARRYATVSQCAYCKASAS
jgi:hypothetical protein